MSRWVHALGYAVLAAAIAVALHLSFAHSDRNRCLQSQHVWHVGRDIITAQNEHVFPPADQRDDVAVVQRYDAANTHRDVVRRRLLGELGSEPSC